MLPAALPRPGRPGLDILCTNIVPILGRRRRSACGAEGLCAPTMIGRLADCGRLALCRSWRGCDVSICLRCGQASMGWRTGFRGNREGKQRRGPREKCHVFHFWSPLSPHPFDRVHLRASHLSDSRIAASFHSSDCLLCSFQFGALSFADEFQTIQRSWSHGRSLAYRAPWGARRTSHSDRPPSWLQRCTAYSQQEPMGGCGLSFFLCVRRCEGCMLEDMPNAEQAFRRQRVAEGPTASLIPHSGQFRPRWLLGISPFAIATSCALPTLRV